MKSVKIVFAIAALAGVTLFLQGCYEEQQVIMMQGELVPMTQQDVIQMVRDGASNADIIREIRESGTVFRLSASEIENLKNEGVPEEVIDFMLETREAPPMVVQRRVVARPAAVMYDPWWSWDYHYAPGYYYYPWRVGLGFSYVHYGGGARVYHHYRPSYGIHYRRYR